jgi:hypothetical protein
MNCGLVGNVEHSIAIDLSQSSMTVWQTQNPSVRVSGSAQINGDTIKADYGLSGSWSVTPYPDGQSAKVRFTAFLLDSTAVFRREANASVATNPSTSIESSQHTATPVAKPVPGRLGFVYNPFEPNANRLLDVRGKASGSKVKDPVSGKFFIVP